jgi:hypothetical protein
MTYLVLPLLRWLCRWLDGPSNVAPREYGRTGQKAAELIAMGWGRW